jgi:hypothetical protein
VLEEQGMDRFSLYKLPHDDEDDDAVRDEDEAPRCLPSAALSLAYSLVGSSPQFEALGSSIAIYGYSFVISPVPCTGHLITLVYHTKKGTLDGGGGFCRTCRKTTTSTGRVSRITITPQRPSATSCAC